MKITVIFIVILAIVAGGATFWYRAEKAKADDVAPAAPDTAKVVRQDISLTVDATGAVASNQDVDIKCQASGVVDKLPYTDVSAHVLPGALLMQLDFGNEKPPLELANAVVLGDESKLREANENYQIAQENLVTTQQIDEANLASTKATMDDAQNKARRTLELYQKKLESEEDVETANTTASIAQAAYKSAQVAVEELEQAKEAIKTKQEEILQMEQQLDQDKSRAATAQQNLDYCTVRAPEALDPKDPPDWVISAIGLNLNIGYLVQSGSSGFSGGTTVMTLSDMSHMFVLATVDESDFGLVEQAFNSGHEIPVALTADSFRNVNFTGKVVRIATKGVNTNNVVTFEVKIEVTSPNRVLLRPSMTANVEMLIGQRNNCLAIPINAVVAKHSDADAMIADYGKLGPNATPVAAESTATATSPAKKRPKSSSLLMPNIGPRPATVEVVMPDGSTQKRQIVIGLHDDSDTVYEVVSGDLKAGEVVKLQKFDANSRWQGAGTKKQGGQHAH